MKKLWVNRKVELRRTHYRVRSSNQHPSVSSRHDHDVLDGVSFTPQVPIQFWQHEVADMRLRTEVKSSSVLDYACDEPTLPPHLTLTVKGAGSSEVTADMNFFREYNKLYYENFIYIAATHTFSQYASAIAPVSSKVLERFQA